MSRQLRVLVIIDDLRVAGAQRVLAEEARAIERARVALQVVALASPPGESVAAAIAESGVPVRYLPGRGLLDGRRVARLVRLIRTLRPDLVHTHLTYANTLGVLAARLAARPVVASMHGLTTDQPRLNQLKRAIESFVLRWGADRCVVVSETALKDTMRNFRLPPDRVVVLPNAINLEHVRLPLHFDRHRKRQELGAAPDDLLICTVARLDPDKGHQILLRAAEALAPRYPRARYLFVGTGRDEHRLRARASGSSFASRVGFLGVRRDVPEILAASDLFVLPSLSETFSVATREAMALGTPIVATCLPGVSEVVVPGETGWLVPPGEPTALAEAIDEALSDRERAASYARRGRALVQEQLAIGPHIRRLETLYREVLDRVERPGEAHHTQLN